MSKLRTYIERSIALHLGLDPEGTYLTSIDASLSSFVDSATSSSSPANPLFVWWDPSSSSSTSSPLNATNSPTSTIRNDGLLVFLASPTSSSSASSSSVRSLLINPRRFDDDAPQTISYSNVMAAVQAFAIQLSNPNSSPMTNASTNNTPAIPTILLTPHPEIQSAIDANQTPSEEISLSSASSLNLDSVAITNPFLDSLQKTTNSWIREIQKLTTLITHEPPPPSTPDPQNIELVSDTVSFWDKLLHNLISVQQKLTSEPTLVGTLLLLKQNNRFQATHAITVDTNLSPAIDHATDVTMFLKKYPLESLTNSTTIEDLTKATQECVLYVANKLRSSKNFTLSRAASLLSSTTYSVATKLAEIIAKSNAFTDYSRFRQICDETFQLSSSFDAAWQKLKSSFLDHGRRRGSTSSSADTKTSANVALKTFEAIHIFHSPLIARIRDIDAIQTTGNDLTVVVSDVLPNSNNEILQKLSSAIDIFSTSPMLLDTTPSGCQHFAIADQKYYRSIDSVENDLAKLLKRKLESAISDTNQMFEIFGQFNKLFIRPRIRQAIKSFESSLIKSVESSVQHLRSKFTLQFENSEVEQWLAMRDVVGVSGKIIWARRMESELKLLMSRMEDVLGMGWDQQISGRQLKRICDELLSKLDTNHIFRAWMKKIEREVTSNRGKHRQLSYLMSIKKTHQNNLKLHVNYSDTSINLFKEVRNLAWLGFTIPSTIKTLSDEAGKKYPPAMTLKESLQAYTTTRQQLSDDVVVSLVAKDLKDIRSVIEEAFNQTSQTNDSTPTKTITKRVRWDSTDVTSWVNKFSEKVFVFQERVEVLLGLTDTIEKTLEHLSMVDYNQTGYKTIISKVQKQVDELSLSSYDHLDSYVEYLNNKMEDMLTNQLINALETWPHATKQSAQNAVLISIKMQNQLIFTSPTISKAREIYFDQLRGFVSTVTSLPKVVAGRFDVLNRSDTGSASASENFSSIITRMKLSNSDKLLEPYKKISDDVRAADVYTEQWLTYQFLWDLSISTITGSVGTDIPKWSDLLSSISTSRKILDDSSNQIKRIGLIDIDSSNVNSKVIMKYDAVQNQLQQHFAEEVLKPITQETLQTLTTSKQKLEVVMLEGSTNDIIEGVGVIQMLNQKSDQFDKLTKSIFAAENLLKQQRVQFPSSWIYASNLLGNFESFSQILSERSKEMEELLPSLQQRVKTEDKMGTHRIGDIVKKWEKDKPLRGSYKCSSALNILAKFEVSLNKLLNESDLLSRAKDALNLPPAGENPLLVVREELKELEEVWKCVEPIHFTLESIKDTLWQSANIKKIESQLMDTLTALRNLPNRIRQFDSYTHMHNTIKTYLDHFNLLHELKAESIKSRHWKAIQARLTLKISMSELTIGHLWDGGLLTKTKELQEIFSIATGEMALEQFISQVKEFWLGETLNLVLYQNRVRLIKGFDELLSKIEEHLNSLGLMKLSPYFRSVPEFQEEAKMLEERLTKLRSIFDAWVDIQRRWIYLESIFFGSADIKQQLPSEYGKFKQVDNDFVLLMRKIAANPVALEVLQMEGLLENLERNGKTMNIIQKSLSEYLEQQRESFSRFYFVGDEDLLEIIGNSTEPTKVFPHLGKMFASIVIMRYVLEAGTVELTHAGSKDSEFVELKKSISINLKSKQPVKSWLFAIESEMSSTLATILNDAISDQDGYANNYIAWADNFPAQIMILASLVIWSMGIEKRLREGQTTEESIHTVTAQLDLMASTVLNDLNGETRKKYEQLITELVHQRDVTRLLNTHHVCSVGDFDWLVHLRFVYNPEQTLMQRLNIRMSNASFYYGFEYLGIGERLVQTPLTDRCYLTLTQALHFRLGGNPFGPAGTGKTESVKALGAQLGRFVLVFNCDESFDFGAMGRLFAGLCQVGAWGCFDEFNRLEERILSAVSSQILTIQQSLQRYSDTVQLLGRSVKIHSNVGIFVTMNPGYAGRSNLPDNLKQLFRAVAMVVPDRNLIAQVMLFSQGIIYAEELSGKIVLLFQLCEEQLSNQSHYDFGLRALKTLLVSAGGLKRVAISSAASTDDMQQTERTVLIQGACNNVVPKLVAEDQPLFRSLLKAVFPGSDVTQLKDEKLRGIVDGVLVQNNFTPSPILTEKILQLRQVLSFRHGVMLVGPTGSGKSTAIKILLQSLQKLDGKKGDSYIIEPKSVSKEQLYGKLDPTTMEWTDGIFTHILRTIVNNQRGESKKRHWIVFDGDVDPEWAENLNSVLDDNKLLTLPSGERLAIPDNVRIILEVDSLEMATPATVSRCGMLWFSEGCISNSMCTRRIHMKLKNGENDDGEDVSKESRLFAGQIEEFFGEDGIVNTMLSYALSRTTIEHVMDPTRERLLRTFECLLNKGVKETIEYNENHIDFPMTNNHLSLFSKNWLHYCLFWAFCGSTSWKSRKSFSDELGLGLDIYEHYVQISDGSFAKYTDIVPRMEIESHKVNQADVVITTSDTLRHFDVLKAWIAARSPVILCGPPGSGKSMTLMAVLNSLPDVVLAPLNFSSTTTPDLILKTFNQYCEYRNTPKGIILCPQKELGANKWLAIFCDEINLPASDKYGTQRVISFLRQLTEHGGFYREGDNAWVTLKNIQFVGACNPPTDAGRVVMSGRFLRHCKLLLVDFPEKESLLQIYETFNGGIMKLFPNLRGYVRPLTDAMVGVYTKNQANFTVDSRPQYFYSPRELTRWVRAIYEAVMGRDAMSPEELVGLWAHEAMRLFHDRLVEDEEREWCKRTIREVAGTYFADAGGAGVIDVEGLFSDWLSKDYAFAESDLLRDFVRARLKVFQEEELDVELVVFNEVLEHVLRIDRVLKQPMGHCLLVGDSGAGKTVLSKFVAWMNGLQIFQIKAHSKYKMEDFNADLREVMRRVGCGGEKVCFIFDENNALSSGFLESMNALLASGEVPGLFEGEDLKTLMESCRESFGRVEEDELYKKFVGRVQRNLHVVFTMNPEGEDFANRSTTSPALFNRCVVDWFGTWGETALEQVGREFIKFVDVGGEDAREAVVSALVTIHSDTKKYRAKGIKGYISPRDFLDFIKNFVKIVEEKRSKLEDEQLHINRGLTKLEETEGIVSEMKISLGLKEKELKEKETLANNKLQQMVNDQNAAEKRKVEAERMNLEVTRQQEEITERGKAAEDELGEAEPALIAAQESVKGIKKSQLDEIRGMARPPDNVRMCLEAVAIMLGERKLDWSEIRKMLNNKEFIPNVLKFDLDRLGERQIMVVKDNYLGDSNLTVESVTRSSKACGPLYSWVRSQIMYSEIYNNVLPLREEVDRLRRVASEVMEKKEEVEEEVRELERSIAQYKSDYAGLIRSVEVIKSEMGSVEERVKRAESLLRSLRDEKIRWGEGVRSFEEGLSTVVGDGLLCGAFLTYNGFHDHKTRDMLVGMWKGVLGEMQIDYRGDLNLVSYLSAGSDRLLWNGEYKLPNDNLCMENAIILDRYNRFPLVIDPSGQAQHFLLAKYEAKGVVRTSFLDNNFTKVLSASVRFGTPLLVEDVEMLDPILNPLLNRETYRTGGRTLIKLGSEEVDYSPKFELLLVTKEGGSVLTPDLRSRVTLVNFTVTPGSLANQALSMVVQNEKPELEMKRVGLLKLQGERNVKVRELEEKLLGQISGVEGSILENDVLIGGMEEVKKEANKVMEQLSESEVVMKEIELTLTAFGGVAEMVSKIFFELETLKELNHVYQFGLEGYMDIFRGVLEGGEGNNGVNEGGSRLEFLKKELFFQVAARCGRSLLREDKLVFALRLCSIFDGEATTSFLDRGAECCVKEGGDFVRSVFGGGAFPWEGRGLEELGLIVKSECGCMMPVFLVCEVGYDVSKRVEELAALGNNIHNIAMGSSEGYESAERAISIAAKTGEWVLLKNVHLCCDWLGGLEKRLSSSKVDEKFRLFLTAEVNTKLPANILRMSTVITCEPPSGVKANLQRFFSNIDSGRMKDGVKNRLYFLVAWLHAVVQERIRYVPSGWSKRFEFNEADAACSLDMVDGFFDISMAGKKVGCDDVPWEGVKTMLKESLFGAKIDNEFDQAVLDSFVEKLFVGSSFDVDAEVAEGVQICEGNKREDYIEWIEGLGDKSEDPKWLGLLGGAEEARLIMEGKKILGKERELAKLNAVVVDVDSGLVEEGGAGGSRARRKSRRTSSVDSPTRRRADSMDSLRRKMDEILGRFRDLGNVIGEGLEGGKEEMDSLKRFVVREIAVGRKVWACVVHDLVSLSRLLGGEGGSTVGGSSNKLRSLMRAIEFNLVPPEWGDLYESGFVVLDEFVEDLIRRMEQLKLFADCCGGGGNDGTATANLRDFKFWLGGLFHPSAFFTATRQLVAEEGGFSLEKLVLNLKGGDGCRGGGSFSVVDVGVENVSVDKSGLLDMKSEDGGGGLIDCVLEWAEDVGEGEGEGVVVLPLYAKRKRENLVMKVNVNGMGETAVDVIRQRGAALLF